MKRMLFPCPDILVRIAIGDSYAMATEYVNQEKWKSHISDVLRFDRYYAHPREEFSHTPSRYTDDAEMTIGNTLVLLDAPRPITKLVIARSYYDEFMYGGRRKGYSKRFQALLEQVHSGDELLELLDPRSKKNGAAMRSVVCGVIPDIDEMLAFATLQASITHDTAEGRFSARAVALMAHYALYEPGKLWEMGAFCLKHLPEEDRRFGHVFMLPWDPKCQVVNHKNRPVSIATVHAVAYLVMHGTSLMDILERTIRIGGDTDSVAAIAWGVASPRYQREDLPAFMERDLEGGDPKTGTVRLRNLGRRLMERYAIA
ncbi:MAG: ADP-ribosylglycohydrolase family protein [Candidatus Uhrbacteria bacterium]|nr:ADP-ribosylglycohydrolase family protein [Candidatus Uhrbacteria bacterium]